RRHTRSKRDWSSDMCSSDLTALQQAQEAFGVVIPAAANERLARLRTSPQERITRALAGNLSAVLVDGWQEQGPRRRLRYWLHFLWPPAEYMRSRYQVAGRRRLLIAYFRRIVRGMYRVPQDMLAGVTKVLKQRT